MEEVGGDGIKIVPRFQFRNWNIYDYQAFVSQSDREAPVVAQAILNQVRYVWLFVSSKPMAL